MTLVDQARVRQALTHRGPECRVAAVRGSLGGGLVGEFDELIADLTVYATVAERTLKDHDIRLPSDSIQRHRSGRCKCSDVAA